MAKRKSKQSINDMVGENKHEIGTPKKFFGQAGIGGDTSYADVPDPTMLGDTAPMIGGDSPGFINDKQMILMEQRTNEYNAKVNTLDPKYATELIPLKKFIVRCYLLETERSPMGIIMPPKVVVDIPTNSGVGKLGEVDSPFPYSTKAVIVASPPAYAQNPNSPFQPGTTVILSGSPLKVVAQDKDGTLFDMPAAFMHPDYKGKQPPKDMSSPHYGYLLISLGDMEFILPNNNTNGEEKSTVETNDEEASNDSKENS